MNNLPFVSASSIAFPMNFSPGYCANASQVGGVPNPGTNATCPPTDPSNYTAGQIIWTASGPVPAPACGSN